MDMTEIRRLEEQKVGKIKLSDAIRIGARIRPQCTRRMFENGASCAMGAAYEAMTGLYDVPANDAYEYVENSLNIRGSIIHTIVIMNYNHTREQIADFVQAQGY